MVINVKQTTKFVFVFERIVIEMECAELKSSSARMQLKLDGLNECKFYCNKKPHIFISWINYESSNWTKVSLLFLFLFFIPLSLHSTSFLTTYLKQFLKKGKLNIKFLWMSGMNECSAIMRTSYKAIQLSAVKCWHIVYFTHFIISKTKIHCGVCFLLQHFGCLSFR